MSLLQLDLLFSVTISPPNTIAFVLLFGNTLIVNLAIGGGLSPVIGGDNHLPGIIKVIIIIIVLLIHYSLLRLPGDVVMFIV